MWVIALVQDLESAVLAEELLTLFFAQNVAQSVQRAKYETKHGDIP